MEGSFESKIKTYNEKAFDHRQNWKKIRALVNFSQTLKKFDEWNALEFIIRYFAKGFLRPKQQELLDDTLNLYGIDYTLWCIKTPWVKNQIAACQEKGVQKAQQLYMWFPELEKKREEDRLKMPLYSKLEKYKQIQLEAF